MVCVRVLVCGDWKSDFERKEKLLEKPFFKFESNTEAVLTRNALPFVIAPFPQASDGYIPEGLFVVNVFCGDEILWYVKKGREEKAISGDKITQADDGPGGAARSEVLLVPHDFYVNSSSALMT